MKIGIGDIQPDDFTAFMCYLRDVLWEDLMYRHPDYKGKPPKIVK